jgi:aminomethyltransferase
MAIPDGSVARAGYSVYVDEKLVGTLTSGTMVPYWKMEGAGLKSKPSAESSQRAICLAYLNADLKEGQRTKVVIRNKVANGVIVDRHMGSEAPPYARPLLVEK